MLARFKVTFMPDKGYYSDEQGNMYCRPYANKMAKLDGDTNELFTICDSDKFPDTRDELWLTKDDGSKPYNIVY